MNEFNEILNPLEANKTWIQQGFINPTHGGKHGRGYVLGEKFEELVV